MPRGSSINTTSRLTDPRNVGDKSFMNASIRALIEYLSQHGYDQPLSPKILTKPTNKDFNNIVLFLFGQLDPNYRCTGRFEDEMTTMFKFLGYPFQIAKSHIQAVGSPHAWPTLLACIMWLLELLSYDEQVRLDQSRENEIDIEDPSASEKSFNKFLGRAYRLFLSGKDDDYEAMMRSFIDSFEHKNLSIAHEADNMDRKTQAISTEIEEVKARSAYLPEIESTRNNLKQDLQKFQDLIKQLEQHGQQLKAKTDSRKEELQKLKQSQETVQSEIAKIKSQIATQELSPEDVSHMIAERERLREAQQIASENRQNHQRKIKEMEMALRDNVHQLEESVGMYHKLAEDLKLIPHTARNARGENLAIELDTRAKKKEGLLKTNVRKHLVPILQDMLREINAHTRTLKEELMSEQDALDEMVARKSQLLQDKELQEAKIRRAEAAYQRDKEMMEQAADMHSKELDAMEAKLLKVRDCASEEARIASAMRRITEAQALLAVKRAEHQRKKNAMYESIMDAVTLCAAHRENVQERLSQLKRQYAGRLESFLNVDGSPKMLNAEEYKAISANILNAAPTEVSQISLRSHLQMITNKPHSTNDSYYSELSVIDDRHNLPVSTYSATQSQRFAKAEPSHMEYNNNSFNLYSIDREAPFTASAPSPIYMGTVPRSLFNHLNEAEPEPSKINNPINFPYNNNHENIDYYDVEQPLTTEKVTSSKYMSNSQSKVFFAYFFIHDLLLCIVSTISLVALSQNKITTTVLQKETCTDPTVRLMRRDRENTTLRLANLIIPIFLI